MSRVAVFGRGIVAADETVAGCGAYLHLVWSTWDRHPLVTDEMKPDIYRAIRGECSRMKVDVIAIGGIADHVHLLVRTPSAIAPARLAKRVEGASSHLVNHAGGRIPFFRWQGGYGAFSVSKNQVPRIRDHVLRQEEHPRERRLAPRPGAAPDSGPAKRGPGSKPWWMG